MKPYKLALIPASLLAMTSFAFAGEIKADDVVFAEGAVTASLTGVAGDAANGRKVFANRKQGNCLACHVNTDLSEQPFHGEVGPPLDGVAGRWEEAQLRGILVNSKNTFEGSIMPSFYRTTNGARPLKKFDGKTILSAQQVEDVLAYLKTLQEWRVL
ncbi:MAG: sulfur oxidation c-type cytochrome SoxX [Alphaproteobacteria bacterium]|nr:sulfur oxidation c-type cytochrome SoxX [Alphaproteobacteria bacterium]